MQEAKNSCNGSLVCLNIGTEAYPKYRDKGCHNADNCLECAADSRGKDAKEALSKSKT